MSELDRIIGYEEIKAELSRFASRKFDSLTP